MEHTSFSPGVRRMMARGGANESFEDGRRDWDELAGVPGTAREVGGVAEAMGAQVQTVADRERVQVMAGPLLPLVPPVPILYIAMDGTGVPVVPSETAGRQGQRTAIAQTREANLGAVFTQTTGAAKGHPMREEAATTSVGCLETAEAFGPRLDAEAVKRGVHRAKKVLVLGDGAAWIRGMTQEHCSPATQMVDLCHALEYLWDVGTVVDGPTA
jgi:hypothetical protein